MEIVICVALKDCYFLRKNLYFIKKNLSPEHIWIITDKRNFKRIPHNDSSITCIDENQLLPNLSYSRIKQLIDKYIGSKNYGWYYQQFLKLGFALSDYARKEYLVWDSDTVPLKEIKFKYFKNKSTFNNEILNNNIVESDVVFISDSKEIVTHKQIYPSVK